MSEEEIHLSDFGVLAERVFLENGIIPFDATMPKIPGEVLRLYRAWEHQTGFEAAAESEPWVPVGALGPIMILGHYHPDLQPAAIPDWFSGRVLIRESVYRRFLEEMIGDRKTGDGAAPALAPQKGLPEAQPEFPHDQDAIQFLAAHALMDVGQRSIVAAAVEVENMSSEMRESVMFLRHRYPIIDLRFSGPRDRLLALGPTACGKYSTYCFFQSPQYYFLAGPQMPPNPLCFEFEDHFRAETKGAPAGRLKMVFVLTAPAHITSSSMRRRSTIAAREETVQSSDAFITGEYAHRISADELKAIDPEKTNTSEVTIVKWLLGTGLQAAAADLHIDLHSGQGRYRISVDGRLRTVLRLELARHRIVAGILRDMSGMTKGAFRPESARFGFRLDDQIVDIRVEGTPFRDGRDNIQFFTLRFLYNSTRKRTLNDLKLRDFVIRDIRDFVNRQRGLVLITGPTGSGKTTTINCVIHELNDPRAKIVTAEDPIEQVIDGVDQVEVNEERGVSFLALLRSFLRHAPNIIVVGEIRDKETAQIALQAANTGHLVISTLHTNTAVGAVNRMVDSFDVDAGILADSLAGLGAQRLLRSLCPECKLEVEVTPKLRDLFKAHQIDCKRVIYRANTTRPECPICRGDGYYGRFAVIETVRITPEIHSAIIRKATERQLQEQAEKDGAIRLYRDALMRVADGLTDLEQAQTTRLVGEE